MLFTAGGFDPPPQARTTGGTQDTHPIAMLLTMLGRNPDFLYKSSSCAIRYTIRPLMSPKIPGRPRRWSNLLLSVTRAAVAARTERPGSRRQRRTTTDWLCRIDW